MSLVLVFRPEAEADLLETQHWYEEQQPGLGEAFAERVEEGIGRIQSMPAMYTTSRIE